MNRTHTDDDAAGSLTAADLGAVDGGGLGHGFGCRRRAAAAARSARQGVNKVEETRGGESTGGEAEGGAVGARVDGYQRRRGDGGWWASEGLTARLGRERVMEELEAGRSSVAGVVAGGERRPGGGERLPRAWVAEGDGDDGGSGWLGRCWARRLSRESSRAAAMARSGLRWRILGR